MIRTARYDSESLGIIAEILKSIAFPARLQIIELLLEQNIMPVSKLIEQTQIEPTLISHHLSKMKNSGILGSYREGRNIYYELKMPEISKIFTCIDECGILTNK